MSVTDVYKGTTESLVFRRISGTLILNMAYPNTERAGIDLVAAAGSEYGLTSPAGWSKGGLRSLREISVGRSWP